MRMPIASKNSVISFASGAPPETGHAQAPAERLADLAEDEPVGDACLRAQPARNRLPFALEAADLAPDGERPVDEAPLASRSPRRSERGRRCAPSRRRAARSAGASGAPAAAPRATRSGSARNAIVKPTYAPEQQHQPPVVVREREVEEHHVVRRGSTSPPSGRRRSPSRSSCGSRACSPSAGRSSRTCR